MCIRLIVGFLVAFISVFSANAAEIERIDVLRTGIMEAVSKGKSISNPDISTGQINETDTRLVKETTTIPARQNTIFGAEIRTIGRPQGARTEVTITWLYPKPGLLNPDTGTAKFLDTYTTTLTLGATDVFHWTLGREWTLVPGQWTLEIWQGNRRLMAQNFTLVR